MWVFVQRTGQMIRADRVVVGIGYAGMGVAKNDPTAQCQHNAGPLPRGLYTIRAPVDTPLHGKFVLWLTPDPTNQMCQRGDFGIHGDSSKHPGRASQGCIIMAWSVREMIWQSGDHELSVIEGAV